MTTLDELAVQAHEVPVRPGTVLITVIGAFFFAIGWLGGASWRVLARAVPLIWAALTFAGRSARLGYWRGLGMTDEQIEATVRARSTPVPAEAQ